MLSLQMDVLKVQYIDLYLEYRCLLNHHHDWMYGKQLIKGVKRFTKPPKDKWKQSEEESRKADNSKPEYSLSAACYKVLGEVIDTNEKNEVRDIIIHGTDEEIEENKERILRYNESDIKYLPRLFKGILNEYQKRLKDYPEHLKTLKEEMLLRGNYSARTAVMESLGYPIDFAATKSFSESVPTILWEVQDEINKLFPRILPFTKSKLGVHSWSHVRTRLWIEEQGFKGWVKTDTKLDSLALKAWKKFFPFSHSYPKDNFGAQMVRYLTLRQQLNGFLQSKSAKRKGNFWDYVGSDKRVRPYFGIYGSQSARSQPKATGFLFLKSAWMRALCVPRKGRAICGIDYKSQEFLLAALLSGDAAMLKAYQSGDPYLYLAKIAGKVPWDGERKDYQKERNVFKVVTLALQYGMGKYSLSNDLTQKLGKRFSESKAEQLIYKFNRAYPVHAKWKRKVLSQYRKQKFWKLPCGWYMWGDNKNERSIGNVPIQGFGSSIMRKAVEFAQDKGLQVILTLHDAIYVEYDSGNHCAVDLLQESMASAFSFYFNGGRRDNALVGLDANIWGQDFVDGKFRTEKVEGKMQKTYMDERGAKEYASFKQYFEPTDYNI